MIPILVFVLFLSPQAPALPATESLRSRVEQLQDKQNTIIRGERLRQREAVIHFYQARNFTPAWQGRADQIVVAIREIELDGLTPADYHLAAIDALRSASPTASGRDADLEILVTDAVSALVTRCGSGRCGR